ncbi:MAG: CoA transferase, partial [Chloroflexi bacterium]|nr:CoA transferase [Chloroflexota bacterium]
PESATRGGDMADRALTGIRVLDLSQKVVGPFCTKLLADMGAAVLKVEPPSGDPARGYGPFRDDPDPEAAGYFLHLNTSKRGITLNIESAAGQDLLRRLVRNADIVVESFTPGYLASLGLGYDDLARENPSLILVSITPFGQTGPKAGWQGSELTMFATGGHMFVEGKPGRPPLKYAGYKASQFAGTHAAVAALGAAMHQLLTGEGQHVDVSIQECQMVPAEQVSRLLRYAYSGEPGPRAGSNRAVSGFLSGIFPCADGFIQILSANHAWWGRNARMMGMPEIVTDPRFATVNDRIANWGEFEALLYPWLMEHTQIEVVQAAQAARVPTAPVYTVDRMPDDPQLKEREFFVELDHPAAGTSLYPGAPYKFSETPWTAAPAPTLGQHNAEVYGELGLNDASIAALRDQGVV